MSKYAADTSVSPEASRMEIEKTLSRYGATAFAYMSRDCAAAVMFEMCNRRIKFIVPLPDKNLREFTHTPSRGQKRTPAQAYEAWNQACRQRWRALSLCIKAKLEAVESGISQFEEEFLAHIVLPNGQTYGEFALPQIAIAYERQQMPPMLPGSTS